MGGYSRLQSATQPSTCKLIRKIKPDGADGSAVTVKPPVKASSIRLVGGMTFIESIPTISEVEEFISAYKSIIYALTKKDYSNAWNNPRDVAHFCVAVWICKRSNVPPTDYITRLFRMHRRMESGKIVPPHQLCTAFAEKTALELSAINKNSYCGIREAIAKALLNNDIPLDEDKEYWSAYEYIEINLVIDGSEDADLILAHYAILAHNIVYVAERQFRKYGKVEAKVISYIKKNKIDYEVPSEKN